MTTTKKLGLVHLDIDNLGTEVWLVSNPEETQEAFDAEPQLCSACRGWGEYRYPDGVGHCQECDGTGEEGQSALDRAADVSKDPIVLRAHWGNDIPDKDDEGRQWLKETLEACDDPDTVRELVEQWWED